MKTNKTGKIFIVLIASVLGIIFAVGDIPIFIKAESNIPKEAVRTKKEEQLLSAKTEKIIHSEPDMSDSHMIKEFPVLNQMPELPTGCEITAMTMVLNYYGYSTDKVQMATEYLPTLSSADVYLGDDGILYGNDMNQYFIGDPTTQDGIICGTNAIISATNTFLNANGGGLHAVDKTGTDADRLYRLVKEDIPVVVWCTIGMEDRQNTQGWYTENGQYIDWSKNDHGAVLIGYTKETVTIADPISGIVDYDKDQFEKVFSSRGKQCVILE